MESHNSRGGQKKSPRFYWIFLGLKNVGFQVIGCGLIRGFPTWSKGGKKVTTGNR